MKKSILTLGKTLNKKEQQTISGGRRKCENNQGVCIYFGEQCAELKCVYSF